MIRYYYGKFLNFCSTFGLIVLIASIIYGNKYTVIIALLCSFILSLFVLLSDIKTKKMFYDGWRKFVATFLIYFIIGTGIKSLYILYFSSVDNDTTIYAKVVLLFILIPCLSKYLLLRESSNL